MPDDTRPSKPPPDFATDGTLPTGKIRIRPTWFFGLCVVEELINCRDGSSYWERISGAHDLPNGGTDA